MNVSSMSSSKPACLRLVFLFFLSFFALGLLSIFYKSVEISSADFGSFNGSPRKSQQIKHTQLFLGDAAGENVPGRVHCKGDLHAAATNNKKDCSLSNAERVSFITFFLPSNELSVRMEEVIKAATVVSNNIVISKLDRPYAILSIFFDSIQASNPSTTLTILTSKSANIHVANLSGNVHAARFHRDFIRSNLMLQRLESYVSITGDLLEAKLQASVNTRDTEHLIFMDADIIVVDDLRCLFKTYVDFDIALTFRNNRDQPINSGVIIVRGETESLSRARTFLMDVVEVYKKRFAKASRMLGDQLALAAVVQEHFKKMNLTFKKPLVFKAQISQIRLLFLPSQIYNWTPSEGAGQFHGMPNNVKVLHFKGSRKRLMLEAWKLFKQSGSLLDMECLILKSGRAKYDF